MGYGLYVLALVRVCFCATIIRDRLWTSHELATSIGAAGPHDFTVRLAHTRLCTLGVHRISPTFVTFREAPLNG